MEKRQINLFRDVVPIEIVVQEEKEPRNIEVTFKLTEPIEDIPVETVKKKRKAVVRKTFPKKDERDEPNIPPPPPIKEKKSAIIDDIPTLFIF